MKLKVIKFFWLILAVVAAGMSGCATTTRSVDSVTTVSHHAPPEKQAVEVGPGTMMMQTTKGEHFSAYRLDTQLKGSIMLNTCTVAPQLFFDIEQDGQFYYALSKKDHYKPFGPDQGLEKGLCGVKFSKNDLKVAGLIVGGFVVGEHYAMDVNGEQRPVLVEEPMVNIYAPDFLRKTLKFDSFADDFLSLRYMEERGTQNGYDAQGNLVGVPPEVFERMYEFDLQASKTVEVQGAKVEVVEAGPDRLVYKVVQQLSAE